VNDPGTMPGGGRRAVRATEERLRRDLALLYRIGYRGCLFLVAFGVLAAVLGSATLGSAAVAGILVLLATPVVGALWVGYRALRERDAGLVWIVSGIVLMLLVSTLLQLYR